MWFICMEHMLIRTRYYYNLFYCTTPDALTGLYIICNSIFVVTDSLYINYPLLQEYII